jgi:TRAP-type C4-dicarboxylate transport system permease small subunit
MMLVTVIDVILRAVFNFPVTGTYDLVQLFLVGTVFLSVPDVFLQEKNIVVDFSDHIFPPIIVKLLKLVATTLGIVFLGTLIWRMVPPALDSGRYNEVSPDLSIPMVVHWALMIGALTLAFPAALMALVANIKTTSGKRADR